MDKPKHEYLSNFANILSRVVANHKEVREFLKEESLKKFDNNYDVLYYLVYDEQIGNKVFMDYLISKSSEEEIVEIENSIPLLNIYNVNFEALNVSAENLDVNNNDIPIAVSIPDSIRYYINGSNVFSLAKSNIPAFNIFYVGENACVEEPNQFLKSASREKSVTFKLPEFDNYNNRGNKSVSTAFVTSNNIFNKAIDAHKYFYANDGGIHSKSLQRSYIKQDINVKLDAAKSLLPEEIKTTIDIAGTLNNSKTNAHCNNFL